MDDGAVGRLVLWTMYAQEAPRAPQRLRSLQPVLDSSPRSEDVPDGISADTLSVVAGGERLWLARPGMAVISRSGSAWSAILRHVDDASCPGRLAVRRDDGSEVRSEEDRHGLIKGHDLSSAKGRGRVDVPAGEGHAHRHPRVDVTLDGAQSLARRSEWWLGAGRLARSPGHSSDRRLVSLRGAAHAGCSSDSAIASSSCSTAVSKAVRATSPGDLGMASPPSTGVACVGSGQPGCGPVL
jgi:hypothetical protein